MVMASDDFLLFFLVCFFFIIIGLRFVVLLLLRVLLMLRRMPRAFVLVFSVLLDNFVDMVYQNVCISVYVFRLDGFVFGVCMILFLVMLCVTFDFRFSLRQQLYNGA